MYHSPLRIADAHNLDDLVSIARDYLATFEPDELATVPQEARPTQIKGTDDLAYWHQRLVEAYCTGAAKAEGGETVRLLLHFFARALQRAAELRGHPPVTEYEGVARLFSEHSVPKLFTSAMTGVGERH
jgi:hypothetical protein